MMKLLDVCVMALVIGFLAHGTYLFVHQFLHCMN